MSQPAVVAPVPVRITLNPEQDRVVIVAGDVFSVGLVYEDALILAEQLATVLEMMRERRRGK